MGNIFLAAFASQLMRVNLLFGRNRLLQKEIADIPINQPLRDRIDALEGLLHYLKMGLDHNNLTIIQSTDQAHCRKHFNHPLDVIAYLYDQKKTLSSNELDDILTYCDEQMSTIQHEIKMATQSPVITPCQTEPPISKEGQATLEAIDRLAWAFDLLADTPRNLGKSPMEYASYKGVMSLITFLENAITSRDLIITGSPEYTRIDFTSPYKAIEYCKPFPGKNCTYIPSGEINQIILLIELQMDVVHQSFHSNSSRSWVEQVTKKPLAQETTTEEKLQQHLPSSMNQQKSCDRSHLQQTAHRSSPNTTAGPLEWSVSPVQNHSASPPASFTQRYALTYDQPTEQSVIAH